MDYTVRFTCDDCKLNREIARLEYDISCEDEASLAMCAISDFLSNMMGKYQELELKSKKAQDAFDPMKAKAEEKGFMSDEDIMAEIMAEITAACPSHD